MKSINIECIKNKGKGFSYVRTYSWNDFESKKTFFGKVIPPTRVSDFQYLLNSSGLIYKTKKDVRNAYGITSYSLRFDINVSEQYSSSILKKRQYSRNIFVEEKGAIFNEADCFCRKLLSTREDELLKLSNSFERGASDIVYNEITNHDNVSFSYDSLGLKNLESDSERLGLALAIATLVESKSEECFYLIELHNNSHAEISKIEYKKDSVLEDW